MIFPPNEAFGMTKCACQTEIESRVINQNDCIRFELGDFRDGAGKFAPKPGIIFHHFPEPDHAGLFTPVEK